MSIVNDPGKSSALERARRVQIALVESVRRSRLSTRRRRSYDTGSFSRRRGARLWSAFFALSFSLLFVLPSLASIVYFSFIASPQYVVETKFTVQGGESNGLDGLGISIGLPSANIVQDTQIVANYIHSRAIVEALDSRIHLRSLYSATDIDWPGRFDADKPIEKLVEYWKRMSDVSIQLPGGIVTVRVKAFTREDALRVGDAVLALSETLVNEMNRRMLTENVTAAQQKFDRASIRLGQARVALERTRNTEGMLDAGLAGKALVDLVTGMKSGQLKLQHEYDSQLRVVSREAPQMRAMALRLNAIAEQIRALEAQMTSLSSPAAEVVISESMTKFSVLELERQIAERQYEAAATSLESARATAERRMVYLQTFLKPALPEEPRYPKRLLSVVVVCFGSFITWAALCGIATLARNHMA